MELEEKLVNLLIDKGYHISFAESCTGGLCCGRLVNVANASKVLDMSFVTYANEAKTELLGVSEKTIEEYGVVSEEVAAEMAKGASNRAKSEIGVGITGVAGPTGGTEKKPVGMVCFGFCINGKTITKTQLFGEIGRNEVRKSSVNFVFQSLTDLLK
ncbi:MAG: CinA family protein [Eubacterium sp.]|nr:CinA family protein [Eubacterium sp.]